jgi:hypothetical protein
LAGAGSGDGASLRFLAMTAPASDMSYRDSAPR